MITFSCFVFQAIYDDHLCANVIIALGFGGGGILLSGNPRLDFPYLLPFQSFLEFFDFEETNLRNLLTFDWFKMEYICKDQQWVCEQEETATILANLRRELKSVKFDSDYVESLMRNNSFISDN